MKKFTKEEIEELELLYNGVGEVCEGVSVISDEVVDTQRWKVTRKMIFQYHEEYYQLKYQVGATENQDCDWCCGYEPDCVQVFPKEVTVIEYVTEDKL